MNQISPLRLLSPILLCIILILSSCNARQVVALNEEAKKANQDSIITRYANNRAHTFNYRYQLPEWQAALDEGLQQDSTIAYLWQQKAMPYFKSRKYEVGMRYLDKAVHYDRKRYLPYRAFIKCIFSKSYAASIVDFEESIKIWGDTYEMDHTYTFYIALAQLMLNEFENAERNFKKTIATQTLTMGEAHHLDLFYYALTHYELQQYKEALAIFDICLKQYPKFSDALYYKALCLFRIGRPEAEYMELMQLGQEYAKQGYTINEGNAVYEPYPYQVDWGDYH